MIKFYLGGSMSYHHSTNQLHKATEWRDYISTKLDEHFMYNYFNPMINFSKNVKTANNKTIVQQNQLYLDKCDIMIVNLECIDKSPGTLYEVFDYGAKNKPVIAFGESSWTLIPHIAESLTVTLETKEDVIEYIRDYYNQ